MTADDADVGGDRARALGDERLRGILAALYAARWPGQERRRLEGRVVRYGLFGEARLKPKRFWGEPAWRIGDVEAECTAEVEAEGCPVPPSFTTTLHGAGVIADGRIVEMRSMDLWGLGSVRPARPRAVADVLVRIADEHGVPLAPELRTESAYVAAQR